MKKVLILITSLFLFIGLTGCNLELEEDEISSEKIKVTYVSDYYVTDEGIEIIEKEIVKVKPGLLEEPDEPEKEGYKFECWAYYNEKKDKFVEWDFDEDEADENIKLYAQWVIGVTVTFVVENKIYSTKTVEEGEKVKAPKDPSLDDYEFIGWYLDGQIFDFDTKITSDITLVAKFKNLNAQTYRLGMGIVVSTSSSQNAYLSQIDATVAAVVLDEEGKIVMCRLDAVYNKIDVDSEGHITMPDYFKTKMELGDDYSMAKYGQSLDWNCDGIVLEWYQQAQAFEKHVVGMTVNEVMNMPLQTTGSGYIISGDNELLAAGCTIQIVDFQEAVVKACEDQQYMNFETSEEFILGVAAKSFDDGSSSASYGTAGEIRVSSDFAATVISNNVIIAALNDAIQPRIIVSPLGELTSNFYGTKRELKENYGLHQALNYGMDANEDGIVLEWYLQSFEFSNYVVGLSKNEVINLETATNKFGYQMSTDDDLLAAGCTIQITGFKEIVVKAIEYAR